MLSARGLCVARGGVMVLADLSFDLNAGQALLLRGPNGAGKTTLLRALAGLQPPLAGQITAPDEAMAYGGHADGVKPTLTVAENLAFWARLYGQREIGPALAQMQLQGLAQRRAAHLSAGQKRRLGLARILVTGRPIWLLDEPTVSLDQATVALFGQMVQAHLGQGGAALIASHIDLGFAAQVLDLGPYRPARHAPALAGAFDGAFL